MKDFLKKLKEKLINKTSIVFVVGAVLGALGANLPQETIAKVVCLLNVTGCN